MLNKFLKNIGLKERQIISLFGVPTSWSDPEHLSNAIQFPSFLTAMVKRMHNVSVFIAYLIPPYTSAI
jgi:hypothetical protein